MFKPKEMTKVVIAAQKSCMKRVISELHQLKCMHIKEHKNSELLKIGSPFDEASHISETIVRVRSLKSALGIKRNDSSKQEVSENKASMETDVISEKSLSIQQDINSKLDEIKSMELKIEKNNSIIDELKQFAGLGIPLESFSEYKSLAYFAGTAKDIENLELKLKNITKKVAVYRQENNLGNSIAVFIDIKMRDKALEILSLHKFSPANMAGIDKLEGTADENISRLLEENSLIEKKILNLKNQMKRIAEVESEFIIDSEKFLVGELEKSEAPLRFAETKEVFIVTGWILNENKEALQKRIRKIGKGIYLKFSEPMENENAPIKLKNPKVVNSFEFFFDLYTIPSYKEIDPTFFIFLTFPLLFGFILGDFGYGIATLMLFLIMRRVMPKAKGFFNILIIASLATILFGLVFGEFFGFEEVGGYHIPHLLSRSEDEGIIELLKLSFIVGVIHINLGLLIGFFNEKKSHGFSQALFAKGGWFVLQIAVFMLGLTPYPKYIGYSLLGLSILMLFKGEGIRGVLEIPGIFGNIMSYARLMAIGVTSVLLALVINNLAKNMFHGGPVLFAAGILLLAVGHIINIAIGILGSFLHSLRLHYVEFFSKFFHGGGIKYSPFGVQKDIE